MISALAAYREIVMASASEKPGRSMNFVDESRVTTGAVQAPSGQASPSSATATVDAVAVDLSVSRDVFAAVDDYFNLGSSGRFDAFHKLTPADKEQFVRIVAELAKSGYIGYEELIVNKKVERHEVTSQVGDDRLRSAKVYDRPKITRH